MIAGRIGHVWLAGAAALAAGMPSSTRAQAWQTFEVSRQLHDSTATRVRVEYAVGRLDVHPTAEPLRYAVQLRYDDSSGRPVYRYDSQQHLLIVGVEGETGRFATRRSADDENVPSMQVALSRAVPTDLDLDVGATQALVELGGIPLTSLHVRSGAADASLRFSSPNPARLSALDVSSGAAGFRAENIANANTSAVKVRSGVGTVDLDFGGHWTEDINVDAGLGLGRMRIHVPGDIGVRVLVTKLLANFSAPGFSKRGDAWVSDNFDRAQHKLLVHAQTTLGDIEIERDAP